MIHWKDNDGKEQGIACDRGEYPPNWKYLCESVLSPEEKRSVERQVTNFWCETMNWKHDFDLWCKYGEAYFTKRHLEQQKERDRKATLTKTVKIHHPDHTPGFRPPVWWG